MPTGPKRGSATPSEFPKPSDRRRTRTFSAPVIPGRSLIPGRAEPTFPPFFRAEVEPVTFRRVPSELPRETIEEIYLAFVALTRADRRSMMVLVPRHVVSRFEGAPFWYGLTVVEHEDELYSFQRVVFPSVEAVPKGGCDQGSLYEVPVDRLSAWDGLTSEESAKRAA